MHQITADYAFGQPLLILLIDHAAIGNKIPFAPFKELTQRDLLFAAATFCMADTNAGLGLRDCGNAAFSIGKVIDRQLDFPDADATVTAVLLEHARFPVC